MISTYLQVDVSQGMRNDEKIRFPGEADQLVSWHDVTAYHLSSLKHSSNLRPSYHIHNSK